MYGCKLGIEGGLFHEIWIKNDTFLVGSDEEHAYVFIILSSKRNKTNNHSYNIETRASSMAVYLEFLLFLGVDPSLGSRKLSIMLVFFFEALRTKKKTNNK